MSFGPDGSFTDVDYSKAALLWVPYNRTRDMDFSFDAMNETAIQVHYWESLVPQPLGARGMFPGFVGQAVFLVERGNYTRSSAPFHLAANDGEALRCYMFTGWHKNTPPNSTEKWHQSDARVMQLTRSRWLIRFDDGLDADFDDGMVWFRLG